MLRQVQRLVLFCGLVANISPANQVGASVVPRDNSTGKNPFNSEFAKFAEETLQKLKVPGLSVAVVDGDQVYAEGYGYSVLPDTRATPETLWYAGSTTKAYTAACLSVLMHSGTYKQLAKNWSTPISSIIKEDFVLSDTWATEHMTLDDAVSHRSGLTRNDKALLQTRNGKTLNLNEIVRNMRNLPLKYEPRTDYSYNNWMYIVMSHVIETITKKWLGDVLREQIWKPLGMNSTYFTPKDAENAKEPMASGYIWNNVTQNYTKTLPMPMNDLSGAAAIISNVLDYAKWIKCLLNETEPFSKDVHEDIRKPRMIESTDTDDAFDISLNGLAWYRNTYRGHVFYRHNGVMIGFGAQVYWFPKEKFGFVMFANGDGQSGDANKAFSMKLIADRLEGPASDYQNITDKSIKSSKEFAEKLANAVNITYPDLPQSRLPSSFSIADLEGKYSDESHGTMELREGTSPKKPDEKFLIAERRDTTWRLAMRLYHVTGEKWIAYASWQDEMDDPGQVYAAEFEKEADGKVSGLKVTWESKVSLGVAEGETVFKRER
ncbi:beta-lactamase [Hirsutella rhossiliensis]|uniref:Beta-lactamase domain-containing protein n=1 Tax=Hirsutella rhossiliensis TaxID=111463 RepID=A0A9P8MX32_9HYPO|nr:beta-lactamase domain-containing protein [Hirsutella rhossiliensis]KAH0962845.1 beta-lactamase domain-containing protein [Hirsutella rhossiliensis]